MNYSIKLNEITLDRSAGHPAPFYGPLSGKTLPGIDLSFSRRGRQNIEAMEHLFKQEIVNVDDPFTGQSYKATLRLCSSSYQGDGYTERHYVAELRALDLAPVFNILEIDGNQYPVLASREEEITKKDREGITRSVLLQLTSDQFLTIQQCLKRDTLSVRRMGVDEQPVLARPGGLAYWSHHKQNGTSFYKQIVPLVFPNDFPRSSGPFLAPLTDQLILSEMVQTLTARFEALVNELAQGGIISSERQQQILDGTWQDLLDTTRLDAIVRRTKQVPDAEAEL